MKTNDVILRTTAKIAVFVIWLFALYLFFAGHNSPGGGFVGGLVTSSGFVLLYLAFGIERVQRVIRIDFIRVTAIGLLIAVMTGIGSFFFDAPFLSHAFGYFYVPLLGENTELATAVLFDLGVYLTVIGGTMTIMLTIGEDSQKWKS